MPRRTQDPLSQQLTLGADTSPQRSPQATSIHTMSPQAQVVVPGQNESCCHFFKFWHIWQQQDTQAPRTAQHQMDAYQAPVMTPPTLMRTYEDDAENRRLLKWTEPSSRGHQQEGTGSGHASSQMLQPVGLSTQNPLGSNPPAGNELTPSKAQVQHHRTSSGADSLRLGGSRHKKIPSFSADYGGKGALVDGAQQEEDDFNTCPTCLEVYTPDNPKTHTACGHHYHLPCLYEWMERKDTCPMCDSPLVFPGM